MSRANGWVLAAALTMMTDQQESQVRLSSVMGLGESGLQKQVADQFHSGTVFQTKIFT